MNNTKEFFYLDNLGWTQEDVKNEVKNQKGIALNTNHYNITKNKEYTLNIEKGQFYNRPYAVFIDDNGENHIAHLDRFKKIKEIN